MDTDLPCPSCGLAQHQRYLDAFLDASPLAISVSDAEGRVLRWNRAAAALFGHAPEAILGQPLPDELRPMSGIPPGGDYRSTLVDRYGNEIPARVIRTLLRGAEGAIERVVTFYEDLRPRIALERQVLRLTTDLQQRVASRTVELEQNVADLELFTAAISHDLRAPLRHLDGFLALSREALASADEDGVRYALERASRATTDLVALVEELHKLAGISRDPLAEDPIHVEALAREAWVSLDDALPRGRARLVLGDLPEVRADRALLKQVFVNLLGNAVKFSAGHDAPEVRVECARSLGGIEFGVRDNGVGFPMAYAARLFKPFSRLHGKNQFSGTGTGLAIVERIVRRHGGSVRAEAAEAAGAAFYFTLPGTRLL